MKPRYALVTYATEPKVLVSVVQDKSSDADWVTEKLNKISYEGRSQGKEAGVRSAVGSGRRAGPGRTALQQGWRGRVAQVAAGVRGIAGM